MHLVVQPCGDKFARRHFEKTIQNLQLLDDLLPFLPAEEKVIAQRSLPKMVAVWGATPAKNGSNFEFWRTMRAGDVAMFSRDRQLFLRGEVAFKVRNDELARKLWGEKSPGETWECMYFLTNLAPINVSIEEFNRAIGRAPNVPNHPIMRFEVFNENRSAEAMVLLDLEDTPTAMACTKEEVREAEHALAALPDEMDRIGKGTNRLEQRLLRKIFLSNKRTERCALCGESVPVELLVIGHIHKRSLCTAKQKRDRANVMPVCLLGCDSFFERRFIYVDPDGTVRIASSAATTEHLDNRLRALEYKRCLAWNAGSEPYFRLHRSS